MSFTNDIDNLTASNDYYFDASLEDDDGDGSSERPYKYLTNNRIKSNSNIYLANGEYDLDSEKTIEQVNIIGSDASKTVIKYDGVAFNVNRFLTLTNVTLKDLSITNSGTLNLTNVFFTDGYRLEVDLYGNSYGGAIYTTYSNADAEVNIVNSTFRDNFALYGGAIYMGAGRLNVVGCEFINNMAYNFGGAIACEKVENVFISKSRFIKNTAMNDAGGAIYIKMSDTFNTSDIEVIGGTATFGGAITTLMVDVCLNNVTAYNNSAIWDGGALYHMYGAFRLNHGNFTGNAARNGGAAYIDNSSSLMITHVLFENNTASNSAGAVFSITNKLEIANSLRLYNTFRNNAAKSENDIYEIDSINTAIGNGNYTLYKFNDTAIDTLPSFYNLVSEGYMAPAKDQMDSGNCWAFTAIAVLESCLKKITGAEFDLSEENMKNVIAMFSDYGWNIETNEGGYTGMLIGYLASWLGPVFEIDDYFDDKSVLSPIFNSILHIQNVIFLKRDNFTANDEIKRAIMKYGAVGTSMYFDDYYLKDELNYYYWNSRTTNHAVTIVGWDDNYSRGNFRFGSSIEGDGAWIVRNSWGSDWGNDGCFYVSYYDGSFAKVDSEGCAYTFILNDTVRLDKNYQYDIAGMTNYLYIDTPSIWYKNSFTSTDNEVLKAVSTYFEKLTDWTLSVYVNGVLKSAKSGISNAGYYTFYLDDEVDLSVGDVFEIVFNTTSDALSSLPVSKSKELNKNLYSHNMSFISFDGKNWQDLFDYSSSYAIYSYSHQVACIKAFTVLNEYDTTLSLEVNGNYNPITVTATVVDQNGRQVKRGCVIFSMDGENIMVNVTDGKASFTRNFEKGIRNISAIFTGNGYVPSSNNISFEVLKESVILNATISKYQNNFTLTVTASKSISKNIVVTINGKAETMKLIGGRLIHKFTDLDNDEYGIEVTLPEDNLYESYSVNLTVSVNVKKTAIIASNFTTTDFSGDLYNVTLVDADGNPVEGKNIIFNINGIKSNALTDSEGRASAIISLACGNYSVNMSFTGDDNYYASSDSASIRVKTKVDVLLEDSVYQNNVLINITLSKPISDVLTLTINGKNQSVDVKDGRGTVNLTGLDNGQYNVTASLGDDYEYFSNNLSIVLDVKNTHIIAQNHTTSDENVTYTVTLLDEDENPLTFRQITFKINGDVHSAFTDNNGNAAADLNLKKGNNLVEISFNGDEGFFNSANSANVIFKPFVSVIINEYNNVTSRYVEAIFSMPINETAIIYINDKNYTADVIGGYTLLSHDNLENGFYNVSVELTGDDYNFTKTYYSFTISIKSTKIISSDFMTTDFSGENYTITLLDENDVPVFNQKISFLIDDEIQQFAYTNQSGHASLPINLNAGNHRISIIYNVPADLIDNYSGCQNASDILVKMNVTTQISISQNLRDASVGISFTKAINDTINVSINGDNMTVTVTDLSTVLNLTGLENGHYTIGIHFDENRYLTSYVESAFTVDVKATGITADDFETYFRSGELYEVALKDQDGLPLASRFVSVIFDDGSNFTSRSGDDGIVYVPVNLTNGVHKVEIIFKGDYNHFSSKAAANITVNPSIVFTGSQYSLNSEYVAYLKGNLTGKIVSVYINGVQRQITPVGDKISFNVGLNVDSYSVQVINPATREVQSQNINVMPRLTDNKDIVMYYGANKAYSVKVYDGHGKLVGAGELVSIKFNGKTYTARSDRNGVASFKLSSKSGTYSITATYKGFSVSNKVVVKPTLITKNIKVKKGKKIKYQAKLLKSNGKPLKGKKITFKFKGKKYKAKTNKKGIAKITIKKSLKSGKYKITAKYGKQSSTRKITVKK